MAEPVHTIADFLTVVRKSGLLTEGQLTEATAAWTDPTLDLPDELPAALIDAGLLTAWQIKQLRKGKHKGFMLGKYKLLGLLGSGGMSSVYLAENPTIGKKVAIKVLPVSRVEQTSFLARFEREARVAFHLGHQNIARAFDKEQSGSIHFIVMEYVEGIDLYSKVKNEGPLDIRDAADYIRQAAVGLHYAHEEGLVHRDIKPANLILDRKGAIKILDLGLALEDDGDDEASLTKAYDEKVLGTADYLAPEQARDSHKADRRSDIYSLGCTLYYLLVGHAPFAQGKLAERIQAHLNKPPPNILEGRSDVPPAIAELYFRMLSKSPQARPQTAQEVADILDAWLKGGVGTFAVAAARTAPPRRGPPRRDSNSMVVGDQAPKSQTGSSVSSSSDISLVPPPSSSPRGGSSGPKQAQAPANRPAFASAVRISTKPSADKTKRSVPSAREASEQEDNESPTPSRRLIPREILGYPIGLWIVMIGGLIAVIVLGVLVVLRMR
jgi:serine/threonine-protein kinase